MCTFAKEISQGDCGRLFLIKCVLVLHILLWIVTSSLRLQISANHVCSNCSSLKGVKLDVFALLLILDQLVHPGTIPF